MNIRCLHCGHTIMLGEAYHSYSGQVRCVVCKHLLQVHLEGGQLRSIELDQKDPDHAYPNTYKPVPNGWTAR